MPQITGGCLCGKVRYSANAEPAFVGICHCTDCQKFSGSSFAVVVGVLEAAFSVEGKLEIYSKTGDTGKLVERRFCPECGSSIVEATGTMLGIPMIYSGTPDDSSWVKPAMQLFCDSAQRWVQLGGFERVPNRYSINTFCPSTKPTSLRPCRISRPRGIDAAFKRDAAEERANTRPRSSP